MQQWNPNFFYKVRVFSLAVDFAAVADSKNDDSLVFDIEVKDDAVTANAEAVGAQLRVRDVFGESE